MGTTTYEQCRYVGGFKGMRASTKATFELSDTQFSLRRPRVYFARSLLRLWANWTAVTDLSVTDTDDGARVELATKARGMGAIVLPGEDAEAVWAVLDELADLKERFHTPPAEEDEGGAEIEAEGADGPDEADTEVEVDAADEAEADETTEG
jgi:hypothetical protein